MIFPASIAYLADGLRRVSGGGDELGLAGVPGDLGLPGVPGAWAAAKLAATNANAPRRAGNFLLKSHLFRQ